MEAEPGYDHERMPVHPSQVLEQRLTDFAVRIIRIANALPRNYAGRHVAQQLLRSGTSAAPNYAEARAAESRSDFIHKLKVVLKELNETRVWLNMIGRAELLLADKLDAVVDENTQLCRIVNASLTTARRNHRK